MLKIMFRDFDMLKKLLHSAVEEALITGGKTIQPEDEIVFTSYKDYLHSMSEQKYAILAVIKKDKPVSVYQLAKILDREFPNVKKDCDYLEQLGFIRQKKLQDARNTKTPELVFDYDQIVIFAPACTYAFHLVPSLAA